MAFILLNYQFTPMPCQLKNVNPVIFLLILYIEGIVTKSSFRHENQPNNAINISHVPSALRVTVMSLHVCRSWASVIHSLNLICIQAFLLSVQLVRGLPLPRLPIIFPSSTSRFILFILVTCLKFLSFHFLMVFRKHH